MKIVVPALEISKEEGFSVEKDIFKRKDFGERLAKLFENSKDELVVGLDAPWGEGKSTFIKMWKGYAEYEREKKFKTIYFDAFANDYQKDPFLALASELYELVEDEGEPKKKNFKEKASKAIKSLTRGALKIGVRAASGGLFDGSVIDSVEAEASELVSKQVDNIVGDIFDNSKEDKKSLENFRKYLEQMAIEEGGGQPIIFIIDELDRCRPDFALELIEQMKHIFSVKGITFLLVLNRKQLEASVKSRYGNDIDSTLYLQKFVKLWLSLPRSSEEHNDNGEKYLKFAFESMREEEEFENSHILPTLVQFIKLKKLSYRTIEQILTYFAIIHNMSSGKKYDDYQIVIAFICYLKVVQVDVFEKIVNNTITFSELIEKTNLDKINDEYHLIEFLITRIKFDLGDEVEKKSMIANKEYKSDYNRYRGSNILNNVAQILNTLESR